MRLLLDTHVLLEVALGDQLPEAARCLIADRANLLMFSAASIWEIAIKARQGKPDFPVNAALFRRRLIESDYRELAITSMHGAAVAALPNIHRDPFDRILVAQAVTEGITLLTGDRMILRYPGPIMALAEAGKVEPN